MMLSEKTRMETIAMKYLTSAEYDFVMNKYHDTAKPFNRFDRFVRRDELFDPTSGDSAEEIYAALEELFKQKDQYPRPVHKALATRYVLENTRILTDPRDMFPLVNMIDAPVNRVFVGGYRREVLSEKLSQVNAQRIRYEKEGAVTIWPDYSHTVPDFERLFSLGFVGILAESEKARVSHASDESKEAFFEGIRITYEGVLSLVRRLALLAEKTVGCEKMEKALTSLLKGAPSTFYEALLLTYIYFMVSEHMEYLQVRSLSHFDRLLYPFWKRDLENGVHEAELRRTLAFFLLQYASIDNYWNQPVFLGGEKIDGTTQINPLSYAFLTVYDELGIFNPKVQIKLSKSAPKDFVLKALDMIRRGHNSIVFVVDETVRRSLERTGVSKEDACRANITGCYEYSAESAFEAAMNYLNLLKPLEFLLHGGKDGVSGRETGYPTPKIEELTSFEILFEEYKKQCALFVDRVVEIVNTYENIFDEMCPTSLLSATYASCLEKGKDAIVGGAKYNGSCIMFGFIADAVDSLTMLKKYVYDRREISLSAFVSMLDADYEGNEKWRLRLLADRDKYGNNKDLPDGIAKELTAFLSACLEGRPNAPRREGRWGAGFHVARMSYTQAPMTLASPNGRRRGEELSKNGSPSMGQNREGATAAILSATKIDASSFSSDYALDLGLLPSAVKGEDGLEAMYALLRTFADRGGHALHINVFDADTLRDAQSHPEKYRDLQIRVCGWNVLWNDIVKAEQDGFIRQAEALV